VGRGAKCFTERTWRDRDDYALRSMAQTRAIGRARRAPLGQVVRIAGYDPAGADEIPAEPDEPPAASGGKIPPSINPDPEQWTCNRLDRAMERQRGRAQDRRTDRE
jgi:hypothetical protein